MEGETELETAIGSAKAVVIPSSVLTRPDSKWPSILAGYSGKIISVAESFEQWVWIPQPGKLSEMAKNVAISARNLAEGRLDPSAEKPLRLGDPRIHPGGIAGADDHDDRAGDGVRGVVH